MGSNRKKVPNSAGGQIPQRKPRQSEDVGKIYDLKLCWHLNSIDFEGPWGFKQAYSGINYLVNETLILNLIEEDVTDEITEKIHELVNFSFPSLDHFFIQLSNFFSCSISAKELGTLLESIERKNFFEEIHTKISAFENKTWNEILSLEGDKHHEVRVEKISRTAQRRLEEIELSDIEQLVSLRLTGKQRLWGIRESNILKVLWWDPEHTVYPSKKKHT